MGCDPDYGPTVEQMVECLRKKHYDEIVNATAQVYKKVSSLWSDSFFLDNTI